MLFLVFFFFDFLFFLSSILIMHVYKRFVAESSCHVQPLIMRDTCVRINESMTFGCVQKQILQCMSW